jgi:hypothetical protein
MKYAYLGIVLLGCSPLRGAMNGTALILEVHHRVSHSANFSNISVYNAFSKSIMEPIEQKKTAQFLFHNNISVAQDLLNDAINITDKEINNYLPAIRTFIDQELEVDKNEWFYGIKKLFFSLKKYESSSFAEVLEQLKAIDAIAAKVSYPRLFYKELQRRESYIRYLLDEVVSHRNTQMYYATGSTVDDLLNEEKEFFGFSKVLSKFIAIEAKQVYFLRGYASLKNPECFIALNICERALKNSRHNRNELERLQHSRTLQRLNNYERTFYNDCIKDSRNLRSQLFLLNNQIGQERYNMRKNLLHEESEKEK